MLRCNLDKVYRYKEYNEAIAYAKQNIDINGMSEQVLKLQEERKAYEGYLQTITEPEREEEDKRYCLWEKWNKVKRICKWILIGLVALWIIMAILGKVLRYSGSHNAYTAFFVLWMFILFLAVISIFAFLVIKIGTWICNKNYTRYMNKVFAKINDANNRFVYQVHAYYRNIDNLYLGSLDPAHREMLLMRREQAEHNRRQEELENERIRLENARLEEAAKTRRAQERLLKIEEERERRYRGY